MINCRNKKVEYMCTNLENTIIIVIADRGHIKVDNIFLNNYPDIMNILVRTTSIEQRAVSFQIKDGMHPEFEKRFIELFVKDFILYTKDEIIKSKLFGTGEENPLFRSALGDYIAIAENSNKTLLTVGDEEFFLNMQDTQMMKFTFH